MVANDNFLNLPEVRNVIISIEGFCGFECVTRCCMTGEEGIDTALTHEMAMTMKARWWESRGMSLEDVKKDGRW